MDPLNVMIVDDSRVAIQVLRSALESLGHRVVRTASSGTEAVDVYKTCNPDLVTMDITMPDMDGITATQKIVKSYPDAQIVMMSSHAQESMVMDALKAGAKGYLVKPIRIERLRGILERVAETRSKGNGRDKNQDLSVRSAIR